MSQKKDKPEEIVAKLRQVDVRVPQGSSVLEAVRTIGLARSRVKIGLVNLAYNMRRLVWLSQRTAPA